MSLKSLYVDLDVLFGCLYWNWYAKVRHRGMDCVDYLCEDDSKDLGEQ